MKINAILPDKGRDLRDDEIADSLQIPFGTVASRLRRAREVFAVHVARLEARSNPHG